MDLFERCSVAALCLLLAACDEKAKVTPPPAGSAVPTTATPEAKATSTTVATAKPSADAPAAPPATAKPAGATCRIKPGGESAYSGPCDFKQEGGNGSFSVTPIGQPTIGGANLISVTITEPGVAEVRGLTPDGINSRWGEAKRSSKDKACWTGSDFEVCVYAGDAGKTAPPKST